MLRLTRTTDSCLAFPWHTLAPRLALLVGVMANAPPPCIAQSPDAAQTAIDTAEQYRVRSILATERDDDVTALIENSRCIAEMKKAQSLESDAFTKSIIADLIRSEYNRAVLFCYKGVHRSNPKDGISERWRQNIVSLAAPQRLILLKDGQGVKLDYTVYMSYAILQQHLADYYARRNDFSRASWHLANAETYFVLYEKVAPADFRDGAEVRRCRVVNRERLQDLIATRGVVQGTYVQNDGVLQEWIGRVTSIEANRFAVRITYASDSAPRGFIEGREVALSRDEFKVVEAISIEAAARGYK